MKKSAIMAAAFFILSVYIILLRKQNSIISHNPSILKIMRQTKKFCFEQVLIYQSKVKKTQVSLCLVVILAPALLALFVCVNTCGSKIPFPISILPCRLYKGNGISICNPCNSLYPFQHHLTGC